MKLSAQPPCVWAAARHRIMLLIGRPPREGPQLIGKTVMRSNQRILDSLVPRVDGLFHTSIMDGTSDILCKAFSVLHYHLEGLEDVIRSLIAGECEAAAESLRILSDGRSVEELRTWGYDSIDGMEESMERVWKPQVTHAEWRQLAGWIAEVRELVDDVARLGWAV
jgi:hypothetical protein